MKRGNDRVTVDFLKVCRVFLHGKHIATIDTTCDNTVVLFDGGYRSKATKSRINAIMRELLGSEFGVVQKNGKWFWKHDGTEFCNGKPFSLS